MPLQSSRSPLTAMAIIILSNLDGVCESSILPILLGTSGIELSECVKEIGQFGLLTEENKATISISKLKVIPNNIMKQALFSSALFNPSTVASSLFFYYQNDYVKFLEEAEATIKLLIKQDRPLAFRRAYDALSRLIIKMPVPTQNKDFCFLFIDKCMKIQREIIKFPSNSKNQLVLFCKIKGIARFIGDQRSISYINICMGTINHNIRPTFKANLYHKNMQRGKDTILSLGDDDIKLMSSQFIVLYYLLEGNFSEGINFAFSFLFSSDNDIRPYLSTALYTYTSICAASMGDYNLAQDILTLGILSISSLSEPPDVSIIKAFIAYVFILQGKHEKALRIINKSLNVHNGQIYTYSDLLCSRTLCFYHFQRGEIQKSYGCFLKLLKANNYTGISHSNYLITPFVLELLGAYYINGFDPPQKLSIHEELKHAMSLPSRPVQAVALCVAGQVRAHDHGWGDPMVCQYLQESLKSFQSFSFSTDIAKTLIALARMYQATNDVHRASKSAQEAWSICHHYGQPLWPNDLDHLLAQPFNTEDNIKGNPFDKNVHFLHNFRSQSTFNPNNNLLNGLLSSLLATFKFSCGCVFHASNPSLDLDVCVYINLAYFNKHPKDIWGQVALKALEKKQSIFINTSNKIKHEITEKHSDNTFDDSNYISIVFYVDALDCGEYIFCISGVAQGSLKNIINDQSIKLFENYISTQICIDKAQHYAQQDHVNSSQNYSHYSKNDIDIIFQSRSMKEVIDRVDNLARKDTTVLILGESGVGKELIAKRLHEESRRKGQFVSVNLANIPYELFESECYGHEKGSFTGAVQKKIGLFELADEGTLFIDEIGDIPLALQVKLLRVLQERQFARVGGTKLLKSNFRLITATNRDLVEEIRQGRFREDLFYRLNVVSIHIPPLRDRQEDIIFLADHFLRYYCSRYQLPTKHIDNDMRQRLYEYPWPGNVRELKNYIERYCVLSDKHFIPLPVQNQLEPQDSQPAPYNNSVSQLVDEKPTLRDLNDAYFEFIYKTKNGAVGGAKGIASILGISRTTAYSWIERLKLKEKYELVLKNSESE